MPKLLRWKRTGEEVGSVHLEFSSGDGKWQRYTAHPLHQLDLITNSSKGFRTAQLLLSAGYKYEAR